MNRDWGRVIDSLVSGSPAEWLGFVLVVAAIAVAIAAVTRYRASLRGDADPAAADARLVRHVREMRDRGEVSEDEYRSLKGRIRRPEGGGVSAPDRDDAGGPRNPLLGGDHGRLASGAITKDGLDPEAGPAKAGG